MPDVTTVMAVEDSTLQVVVQELDSLWQLVVQVVDERVLVFNPEEPNRGEEDPGIMYLTTVELYKCLEACQQETHFEVLISYQEVYNEQIHNLLEPKGPLAICEDPEKGVVPASAKQLLEMLTRDNYNCMQHPTYAKATSSCSHAIFQIFVKQQDWVPGLTQAVQVAKMSLIDLAGSERATSTHAKGKRLQLEAWHCL
ncbi:hypothetical protein P7K49_013166 [Saguinus oedipus]|uniref:Kinesin motor domain-containing protein n=1 Tax=Saguinus oedipus TaxID=9490 RepID=A0ABQ9VFD7_SAGOE|nr:hypothetical protein P7K49_013166 [Saguinus oedipus]